MSYTITQFKDAISRELHGRTTNRLQDAFETAYDAAMILLSEIDPKETQRVTQISPQVFDDVDVYSSPSDFKAVIDLYPSSMRKEGYESDDDFRRTGQKEFSLRRSVEAPMLSEKWINGTRFLLLRKYSSLGRVVQLESFDSTTGITAGGDAGSLDDNQLNFWEGSASLSLTLNGLTGAAHIEKDITSQDLTDYRLLASWFVKVYIPSGFFSRFTSFTLRHGSASGMYWSKTVTAQHDGTAFKDGMNLLRFDWSSATETGTVDETAMDYMRLTFAYSTGAAIPGVLVDDLEIQLGTMYDLDYYSNFLFKSSAGTYLEKPTADGDTINLSTDAYRIFVDLGAMMAMSEISSMAKDYERISRRVGWPTSDNPYAGSIGRYKLMYPSERPVRTTTLHNFSI